MQFQTYTLFVRAIDEVGNIGEYSSLRWRTDFEPPVIDGTRSLLVNCGDSLSVEDIGREVTVSIFVA